MLRAFLVFGLVFFVWIGFVAYGRAVLVEQTVSAPSASGRKVLTCVYVGPLGREERSYRSGPDGAFVRPSCPRITEIDQREFLRSLR